MHLLPLICTSLIVVSAIFLAFGWAQIRKGNREAHQKLMLVSAALALLFFVLYMTRTLVVGNTTFDGPASIKMWYHIFLFFHIILATLAGVFGLVTLNHAFKSRWKVHRKIGRITGVMWLITAPTGVIVYILLYVLYPGGQTKPMLDAIFGW